MDNITNPIKTPITIENSKINYSTITLISLSVIFIISLFLYLSQKIKLPSQNSQNISSAKFDLKKIKNSSDFVDSEKNNKKIFEYSKNNNSYTGELSNYTFYIADESMEIASAIELTDLVDIYDGYTNIEYSISPSESGVTYILFTGYAGEGVDYRLYDENGNTIGDELSSYISKEFPTRFSEWRDSQTLVFKVYEGSIMGDSLSGKIYEVLIDAKTGKAIGQPKQIEKPVQ